MAEYPHKRTPRPNQTRSGQNRFYPHLGVTDLREIIDRKRGEKGEDDFLGDSSRVSKGSHPQSTKEPPNKGITSSPYNKKNLNKNKEDYRRPPTNQSKQNKDIENPLNIKVEFSTLTGEHSYQLDENTVLPTIKHVPDQRYGYRGRGRGRGRGSQRQVRSRKTNEVSGSSIPTDVNVTIPNKTDENWDEPIDNVPPCEKEAEAHEDENLEMMKNMKINEE
ncbi:uncharacterized protein LOC123005961 [Tribolium madens]|uniref:uncharacterized protein LOC123005961 n=1 Tax=Tribolium madens TaxID=41895 RepID=UPI001CF74E1E|nr:uncharacterized protein LOC123005961 [Tribolium madens]XP_044255999.1 uncharacterized protein LOC123005961 [Tribolium madens]